MKKIILILLVLLFSSPVFAVKKLFFNGFVSDNAAVISDDSINYINSFLYDLQKKTGTDIAVVTLYRIYNQSVEDAALEIGRKYKLGSKSLNNGAVVLVVVKDRVMRIEIGYGLEGIITDAHAGRIRDAMLPYFKNEDYESGILKGTYMLASDIAKGYGVELSSAPPKINPFKAPLSNPNLLMFLLICFMIFRISYIWNSAFGARYYGSHTSFGGFSGGGGFGGGGASGRW